MAFSFDIFDGDLPDLPDALAASLPAIGLEEFDFTDSLAPVLVGPFASYSADPRTFVGDGTAERSGWRGLITRGDAPIATVDVSLSGTDKPGLGFHGKESAEALAAALTLAQSLDADERQFEMRCLILPEIYVETLWLVGPTTLFIPTRMGSAQRPAIDIVESEFFQAEVRGLIERATWRGADLLQDTPSPRSGIS